VALELDAVHVEHLALLPVRGRPQVAHGGDGRLDGCPGGVLLGDGDAQAQLAELRGVEANFTKA